MNTSFLSRFPLFLLFSTNSVDDAVLAAEEFALEPAPAAAERLDVVSISGTWEDFYGEVIQRNPVTERTRVYYYDTAWGKWLDMWVNSNLVNVMVPQGALSVQYLFPLDADGNVMEKVQ